MSEAVRRCGAALGALAVAILGGAVLACALLGVLLAVTGGG